MSFLIKVNKPGLYKFLAIPFIFFLSSSALSQINPHLGYGYVFYPDGNKPEAVTFSAYILSRPGDFLDHQSFGCGYDSDNGIWFVQCGSFSTQWRPGDVLRVELSDNEGRTGSIEVPITNEAADYAGNVTLTGNAHPCRLLVEEKKVMRGETVSINIYMENLSAADSLVAYELTLGFNSEAVLPLGAENEGTMTRNWSNPLAHLSEDKLTLGSYTTNQAHTRLVEDGNVLIKAVFKVEDEINKQIVPEALIRVINARLYTLTEEIILSHSKTGVLKQEGLVKILTEPENLAFLADGQTYTAPHLFQWDPGEVYRVEAISPQYYNELTRYVFTEWNTGASIRYNILVQKQAAVYTAYYETSHYLDVRSEYGLPAGGGWHVKGSTVPVSVDSLIQESDNSRRRFTGWTGEGAGSVTASNREITVIVHEPIIQTAAWVSQFKMILSAYPDDVPGISINADPPGPWYDINTVVELSAAIDHSQYSFSGWSGDVQSSEPVISVTVQSALNIVANFNIDGQPPRISDFPVFNITQNEIFERTFEWLSHYVEDDNDSLEDLAYDFTENEYVSCEVSIGQKIFRIIPVQDWTGDTEVVFTVENSLGLSAETVLDIHVYPEDDSPGSFYLISPKDTAIAEWPADVNFIWSRSAADNPNHLISYDFYISPNSSLAGHGTIVYSELSDTALTLRLQEKGAYYWSVWAVDSQQNRTRADTIYQISVITGIVSDPGIPELYLLFQNYPNPFNQSTVIAYSVPESGSLKIAVYDAAGKHVKTLFDGYASAGTYRTAWNGNNGDSQPAASGIYIVRMNAGEYSHHRKMLLIR